MDVNSRIESISPLGRSALATMLSTCSSCKYLYRHMIEGCFDSLIRNVEYRGCKGEKDEIVDLTIIKLNELCK